MPVPLILEQGQKILVLCRRNGAQPIQKVKSSGKVKPQQPYRFSIAPMMEWTDRHCRFFHRLMTRGALLYTEMVTTGAVLHGDRAQLIGFDPFEHPVALQLGGSEPRALAPCARIAQDLGYDEINLNVGCPSDRVQEGRFGACLMAEPEHVGDLREAGYGSHLTRLCLHSEGTSVTQPPHRRRRGQG